MLKTEFVWIHYFGSLLEFNISASYPKSPVTHFHASENFLTGLCTAEYFRGTVTISAVSLTLSHTSLSTRLPRRAYSQVCGAQDSLWLHSVTWKTCLLLRAQTHWLYFWQVPFHSPRIHRVILADDAARIFRLFWISNLALKVEIYRLHSQQKDVVTWVMDICWDVMYTELKFFHSFQFGKGEKIQDLEIHNVARRKIPWILLN